MEGGMSVSGWEALRFFVGTWEGTERGRPGIGRGKREYGYILGGKFLHVRNTSTWAPTEKNPKGEVHEDWGLYSHDRGRDAVVFRQFHIEGFVNRYVLEPAPPERKVFVFVTEAIENLPAGWRARETLRVLGPAEFEEVFELASPGKDFEMYTENRFQRATKL